MYRTTDTHIDINDLILNDFASPDGSSAQAENTHKNKGKGKLVHN